MAPAPAPASVSTAARVAEDTNKAVDAAAAAVAPPAPPAPAPPAVAATPAERAAAERRRQFRAAVAAAAIAAPTAAVAAPPRDTVFEPSGAPTLESTDIFERRETPPNTGGPGEVEEIKTQGAMNLEAIGALFALADEITTPEVKSRATSIVSLLEIVFTDIRTAPEPGPKSSLEKTERRESLKRMAMAARTTTSTSLSDIVLELDDEIAQAEDFVDAEEPAATEEELRDLERLEEIATKTFDYLEGAMTAAAQPPSSASPPVAPVPMAPAAISDEDVHAICAASAPEVPTGIFTTIDGDGWCYYKSVLAANNQPHTTEDARVLASKIRATINADPELKSSLQAEWDKESRVAGTFDNYLEHITEAENSKYWGEGHINSPAVAILKNKAIAIYNRTSDGSYVKNTGQVYCPPDYTNQPFLELAFNGNNHYDAFVSTPRASTTPTASAFPMRLPSVSPPPLPSPSPAPAPAPEPQPEPAPALEPIAATPPVPPPAPAPAIPPPSVPISDLPKRLPTVSPPKVPAAEDFDKDLKILNQMLANRIAERSRAGLPGTFGYMRKNAEVYELQTRIRHVKTLKRIAGYSGGRRRKMNKTRKLTFRRHRKH
jgi:hypothetical protein